MKRLIVPLALCAGIAIFGATAFSAKEQAESAPLLSRLAVGQRVDLESATSGGYECVILNDRYVKHLEESGADYTPHQVIEVGPDFVVVDVGRGIEQAIAAHAIDVVTRLPDTFGDAESRESKSSTEQ